MWLSIYSLKKVWYENEAAAVNCKTLCGEITVLDHHRPLITQLAGGVVKVTEKSGQTHYFNVRGGFLEINAENQARLLIDEA